jgi:hypothetical protein
LVTRVCGVQTRGNQPTLQGAAFVPPEPHPPQAPYGDFWYGADALWTLLRPDGRWHSLPQDDHGYGQKVLWFREGYDMTTEQRDVGEFMLTGVTLPSAGCWEITGSYRQTSLSFIVWVAP